MFSMCVKYICVCISVQQKTSMHISTSKPINMALYKSSTSSFESCDEDQSLCLVIVRLTLPANANNNINAHCMDYDVYSLTFIMRSV